MKISFKALLQKVGAFLEKLFGGAKKFGKFLTEHVDDAISFLTRVREVVESEAGQITIGLLPEKWQEQVENANEILGKIINELSVGEECLQRETAEERLQCLVDYFSTKKPLERTGMYLKVAMLWVKYSSGTKEKESSIDTALQTRIFATKNNLLAA